MELRHRLDHNFLTYLIVKSSREPFNNSVFRSQRPVFCTFFDPAESYNVDTTELGSTLMERLLSLCCFSFLVCGSKSCPKVILLYDIFGGTIIEDISSCAALHDKRGLRNEKLLGMVVSSKGH